VAKFEQLPQRNDGLASPSLQFRIEMHYQFSAVRNEMHAEFSALRIERHDGLAFLREEIRVGDEETRRYMRVLHEEVMGRLAAIQEGQDASRPRRGKMETE
jgi:hypothetical protein